MSSVSERCRYQNNKQCYSTVSYHMLLLFSNFLTIALGLCKRKPEVTSAHHRIMCTCIIGTNSADFGPVGQGRSDLDPDDFYRAACVAV